MVKRLVFAFLALAGLVSGLMAVRQRQASTKGVEGGAVQWPFDPAELRSLMDRVVGEQQQRITSIEDADGRSRAQAFLDYYQRRRQAVAS